MTTKPLRVAIYLRVSTDGQTVENQLQDLTARFSNTAYASYTVTIFRDEGISGSVHSTERPALSKLLDEATRRKFDIIAAWSVDRLGRSLSDLITLLSRVHDLGVSLYLHKQALDTATPAGRAMFSMLGIFAEFEREMIRERVQAGLSRARAQGKTLGRPALSDTLRHKIIQTREDDPTLSLSALAKAHNVSISTVKRILHDHRTTPSLQEESQPSLAGKASGLPLGFLRGQ